MDWKQLRIRLDIYKSGSNEKFFLFNFLFMGKFVNPGVDSEVSGRGLLTGNTIEQQQQR